MKKLSLYTTILSILFFQCQGSYKNPDEFLNSEISFEDVETYYKGFIEYTEEQARLLKTLNAAKKISSWIPFVSGLLNSKVAKEAKKRGYDNNSQSLMCVAELVLDKDWKKRAEGVLLKYSDENLVYLNQAHEQIRPIAQHQEETDRLNEMLRVLHEFHITRLQERKNFNDTMKAQLVENSIAENGQYSFYNYLVSYKEEHGDYPPEVILNMLIPYLYYAHRLIFEKTARWN